MKTETMKAFELKLDGSTVKEALVRFIYDNVDVEVITVDCETHYKLFMEGLLTPRYFRGPFGEVEIIIGKIK